MCYTFEPSETPKRFRIRAASVGWAPSIQSRKWPQSRVSLPFIETGIAETAGQGSTDIRVCEYRSYRTLRTFTHTYYGSSKLRLVRGIYRKRPEELKRRRPIDYWRKLDMSQISTLWKHINFKYQLKYIACLLWTHGTSQNNRDFV